MSTIGDRVSTIATLLGGRTDLNSEISQWLANGYRDLASSIPFETLEDTDNQVCVANIGVYDYPTTARAIKALTIQWPASNPTSSTRLYKRNVNIIDRYVSVNPGMPAIWAPYANQMLLRPLPNDAYPLIVRFWQKVVIDSDINSTILKVPDDWLEIIDYQAMMRGYTSLQEFDRAAQIRSLLYGQGDPKKPGIIKERLTQIQAESMDANYGMRPVINRLTWVK